MENAIFIFIIFLFLINSQINQNPILLVNGSYPFILTINDNDYYYLICSSKILKIEKKSGNIINCQNFIEYYSDSIYAGDNLNNNYIFFSDKYYQIFYNSTNSIFQTKENSISTNIDSFEMTKVGVIAQNNDFIIYGYYNNCLIFYSSKSQDYSYSNKLEYNLEGSLSCKYIEDDNFVCALITNNTLTRICLNYHINTSGSSFLDSYEN